MDPSPSSAATPQEVWHRPFVREHEEWCDAFVLELRLRDVPGSVIGERLGEVEAHCADTGERPADAFGDPTDYARQLDEPASPDQVAGLWRVTVSAAAQVLALLIGTAAAGSWARGEQLSYNVVQVAALGVFVALLLSLPALLRPLLERPWSIGAPVLLLGMLAAVGSAAGGRLDLPVLLSLPPATVTVGLFVIVLVLAAIELRALVRDGEGDPVTSPLAPPSSEPHPHPQRRWTTLLPAALMPIAYVGLSVLSWVLA